MSNGLGLKMDEISVRRSCIYSIPIGCHDRLNRPLISLAGTTVALFLMGCSSSITDHSAERASASSKTAVTTTAIAAPSAAALPTPTTNQGAKPMLRDAYYECAKATDGVTSAIQDCIEAEFEYQDARLNTVYKHLHQKLGGNDKTALVEAQRQWLHEADKKCTWDSATEGQAQRLQANDCLLKLTAMRADELEAMVQN